VINPFLKIKDFRQLIKAKTGIKEENQRIELTIDFNHLNDENFFGDRVKILFKDTSNNIEILISRDVYNLRVLLNFSKTIEELKKMVFEQTKIPIERQNFFLGEKMIQNILSNEDFFERKSNIKK
jgi:hypothetical protein